MKISIIHPSRGRPNEAFACAVRWLTNLSHDYTLKHEISYTLSIEEFEQPQYRQVISSLREIDCPKKVNLSICVSYNDSTNTAITAINNAAKSDWMKDTDIFIVISDDFLCPKNWDLLLLHFIDGAIDFCAKTKDGHQDWLITLPIMDRVYYERFGYIYNPEYKHMHADLDMTCTAWMLDKYISLPIEFKHNHYSITGQKPDAINQRNNATWGQGKVLFNQRLARNFDLTGELKELPKLPRY